MHPAPLLYFVFRHDGVGRTIPGVSEFCLAERILLDEHVRPDKSIAPSDAVHPLCFSEMVTSSEESSQACSECSPAPYR